MGIEKGTHDASRTHGGTAPPLPTVSQMFHQGWSFFTAHWRPVLGITAATLSGPVAIFTLLWPSLVYNELNPNVSESANDAASEQITDQMSLGTLLWFLAALLLLWLLITVYYLASVALVTGADGSDGDRTRFSATWPAIRWGFRRWPAYFGWWIVIYVVVAIAVVIAAVVVLLLMAFNIVVGLIAAFLGLVALFYCLIRWAFIAFAIVDDAPNPFRRSAEASKGRFWSMFGHFFVLAIVHALAFTIFSVLFFVLSQVLLGNTGSTAVTSVSVGGAIGLAVYAFLGATIGALSTWWVYPSLSALYRPAGRRLEP